MTTSSNLNNKKYELEKQKARIGTVKSANRILPMNLHGEMDGANSHVEGANRRSVLAEYAG